ncbi:IMP dehydrogenase [Candidatus Micrarchaeota archaeon]|nr:IMP dehydrogenase [Candidatus Micrarchaeota archaeon]MBU1930257.1 IMP dehydrogenase [Candidatus Micrarchaeota archaeon]
MREIPIGLSFDDVLIVPRKSPVKSRKDINLRTRLSKNISLNIPLISANMDTVTESKMAIAMAQNGGLGIIHRFLPIETQVYEVARVKRSESVFIEDPLRIAPEKNLLDAKHIMEENDIHNVLVVGPSNQLVGIITHRDLLFEDNLNQKVESVMTKDVITASKGTNVEQATELLKKNRLKKLPLIDEKGILCGLYTTKDILNLRHSNGAAKDQKGRLLVGAAVGVKKDFLERTQKLLQAGADIIVVDIAHGHSDLAIETVKSIKKEFGNVEVMAGNVATKEATQDLIAAGADVIKVGVGPGSSCITRIVTGSGVPQITAILDSVEGAGDIPIVADGGLKNSGDIAKALAAGASTIMSGNFFMGTAETPGLAILKGGQKFKVYRGSASFGAAARRREREYGEWDQELENVVPEGVETVFPYKGSVRDIIHQLLGGLRSAISYGGATNISDFQQNVELVRMTPAGFRESNFHDI